VSLSAGPSKEKTEEEIFRHLVERHVALIRSELTKTGRVADPIQLYRKFIGGIRYEFGIRGLLVDDKEAIKMWDTIYLPKYLAGK
jgi:hypothetical protein